MNNNVKLGDAVWTIADWDVRTYVCAGKVGDKLRLVIPGVPGASLLVEPSQVWKHR